MWSSRTSSNAGGRSLTSPSRTRSTDRLFYAFDPRRAAILLIGRSKAGDDQFYERMIPIADHPYEEHLNELQREEQAKGDSEEK